MKNSKVIKVEQEQIEFDNGLSYTQSINLIAANIIGYRLNI
jgi:hypothetical protein